MARVLDITPLRSLIAVADSGGFHRAAASLHLSQSAVSQHVRRLERVVGKALVEPDGRRARFTMSGESLLAEARQIVAAHDEALQRLALPEADEIVIGAAEHAADHILPPVVVAALGRSFPGLRVRFRFDRAAQLNEAVDQGRADLAVFITEAGAGQGTLIGSVPLSWCAAPGWQPPAACEPWPVIAAEEPCAIRKSALAVLARHRIQAKVVAEAAYLAGVLNAARAGLGVTLLALAGEPPEGLVRRGELPPAPPIGLTVRTRLGADPQVARTVLRVLRRTLAVA